MPAIQHQSGRAAQFLALKRDSEKLHELCLKRSDRNPMLNIEMERAAHVAAAKLVQRTGRAITNVWTEDGECPDNGKYRVWYMTTAPIGNS